MNPTSAINPAVNTPKEGLELPKGVVKAKDYIDKTDQFMGATSSILKGVDAVIVKVPDLVKTAVGSASFFGAVVGLASIPNFVSNVSKAIQSSSLIERVKSIGRAVLDLNNMWNAVTSVVMGLKAVRALAMEAFSWMGLVTKILFPLQLIDLAMDAHDIDVSKGKRDDILARVKVEDLTKSCEYITENYTELRTTLAISKKAKIDEKARSILEGLKGSPEEAEKVKAEGVAFMKMLRRRTQTQYNLKVANTIAKVVGIVGAASGLIAPNPVSWTISGLSNLASGAIFVLGKIALNKNPLAEPRDVWYEKVAQKVRVVVDTMTDAVERLALKVAQVRHQKAAAAA